MARRLPVWGTVAFVVLVELLLALHISRLIHPVEIIKQWQLGG